MATHLMLQETDEKKQRDLLLELTGPLRTLGGGSDDPDRAPSWWHGDEEAYESTMAAVNTLPRRRR